MQRVIDPLPLSSDETSQPSLAPSPQVQGSGPAVQPVVETLSAQQAQQPMQAAVVSLDMAPPDQQPSPEVASIRPSKNDPVPIGMSASQMGLDGSSRIIDWKKYVKRTIITLIVLGLLIVGYIIATDFLSGLSTKTLSNNGFTYSFLFYKSARQVRLGNGTLAFKDSNSSIASVEPTTVNPPPVCTDIGYTFRQVFTVKLNGTQYLVCSPNNSDFTMFFTAQDHNQLFTVVYTKQQTSVTLPQVQQIFSSVKVTQ